jgi:hypothetical protein
MGTLFSITAYAATSTCVEQAVALAFQEIDRLESILSHYKPASELSTINREACHRNVTLTPQVFDLLQQSLQLELISYCCKAENGSLNQAVASCGRMVGMSSVMAWSRASLVLAFAERSCCLSFAHAFSMGLRSGE